MSYQLAQPYGGRQLSRPQKGGPAQLAGTTRQTRKGATSRNRRFGSIRQLPNGRWEARWEVGVDPKGRRLQRSKSFGSREEAEAFLGQQAVLSARRLAREGEILTFGEFMTTWLKDIYPEECELNTLRSSRYHARHLIRALGRYRLADLSPAIVERYLEEAKARGLSVGTRRRHLTLLRKALDYAIEKGALHRNPARQVRLRYRNGSVREVLTESELKALWEAAEGSYYRDLFRLYLLTGAREGELLGLCWDDVVWETGEIIIRHNLVYAKADEIDEWLARHPGEGIRLGRSFLLKGPKTETSLRRLPLGQEYMRILQAHRARMERLRRPDWPKLPVDLVFRSRTGMPLSPRHLRLAIKKLAKRAGMDPDMAAKKVRVHALRHGQATHLLLRNVPLKVVAERFGHASTHVTADIYQHVLPPMQGKAVQAVQGLFGAPPVTKCDPDLEPPGTVARIRELYRQGKSYWATAKQLNEEGYRTRRGGKFYHQTVRQILEDPRYRDLAVDRKA